MKLITILGSVLILIGTLIWTFGCSVSGGGKAEARGFTHRVEEWTDDGRTTNQGPSGGFLQSQNQKGGEAGSLGDVSWTSVSLGFGGVGTVILKLLIGGALIFTGVLHIKALKVQTGVIMIIIGVGFILIPIIWIWVGLGLALIAFIWSIVVHHGSLPTTLAWAKGVEDRVMTGGK